MTVVAAQAEFVKGTRYARLLALVERARDRVQRRLLDCDRATVVLEIEGQRLLARLEDAADSELSNLIDTSPALESWFDCD
jgi:hypothetical protein